MTIAPCVHCLLYHGHEPTCPRAAPDQGPDEVLWTYMIWDAGCYRQAPYYLTRQQAEREREKEPLNWGAQSPVYAVPVPWSEPREAIADDHRDAREN